MRPRADAPSASTTSSIDSLDLPGRRSPSPDRLRDDDKGSLLFERRAAAQPDSLPMPRALQSAEDIQAEVRRLIHEHRDVRSSAAVIDVPLPVLQRADGTGLNWWMSGFGNAFGFTEVIGAAVINVGKRWNLIDE
jgi:hypothetical protein